MSTFDQVMWVSRAKRRFETASNKKSGAPATRHVETLVNDLSNIEKLTVVIAWCKAHGIAVNFRKIHLGEYKSIARLININGRISPEKQVYLLLHECGHHLIGDIKNSRRYSRGYPMAHDKAVSKTFQHRCDVLDEEFEAWHRAWNLAERLKLSINRDRFDKFRLSTVRSYLKWVLNPHKFEKDDEPDAEEHETSDDAKAPSAKGRPKAR